MRRRRKKNPLLTRIIVVSLAVHAIALPIAAHFGAFEKVRHTFGSSQLVVINTPPLPEKKIPEKAKKHTEKQRAQPKKGPVTLRRTSAVAKPNPNAPKVIAASGSSSNSDGVTVDPNGAGRAGVLPFVPTQPSANGGGDSSKTSVAPVPSQPRTEAAPARPNNPAPIEPSAPAVSKEKKFVQVETTYAPDPVIPDDLRTDPFEKTAVVEADVNQGGNPENIRVSRSSGVKELDSVALETAKKYKFRAATLDDQPVEGHVRFTIIFKVE